MQNDEPQHTPVQAALVAAERNRWDARRRALFWSAAEWERCLAECRAEQVARDAALQQALDNPQQRSAVQPLYVALEHDVQWYRWLSRELKRLREAWLGDPQVSRALVDELALHEREVDYWLHERHVRLFQVALEFLERRRAAEGRLLPGAWEAQWNGLQGALHAQALFCRQAYEGIVPRTILGAQLRWYERLAAIQSETRRAWGRGGDSDLHGLASAAALVEAEIALLLPPPAVSRNPVPWLVGGAVVAVLLAAVWLGGALADAEEPTVSDAEPERAVLRGSFAPQTGQGPLVVTATPGAAADAPTGHMRAAQANERGLVLLGQGDYAAAAPLFETASAADPAWYEPPNNLAFCRWEQGDPSGAIALWRRSLELNPANADAAAAMGTALYIGGDHAAGVEQYRRAVTLQPRYGDVAWLRSGALWSERIIADSAPLRALVVPAAPPTVK